MNQFTTVVFDCDGTLLDSLTDLKNAMNHVLAAHGYPERTHAEIRRFVGNGLGKLVERSAPTSLTDAERAVLLDELKAYYAKHWQDATAPYDGIYDLLKALEASGYKIAMVSNKIQEGVTALNDRFFKEFIPVAVGEISGIPRKPAPDMVWAALNELGSTKEESVYIGDSEVDLQTAFNSELLPISVTWGFRDEDLLKEHGAVHFAHQPMDVLTILTKLNQ